MALGLAIIRELDIDDRGELLQRWMAHHLAETLNKVQTAVGEEKAKLEADAVDLILKLWSHRRALPDTLDPLGGYSHAVRVLQALHPDANPWRRIAHGQSQQKLLFELFEVMSRSIVAALELTEAGQVRKLGDAEAAHLEEDESALLEQLDEWRAFLSRPVHPAIVVVRTFAYSEAAETANLPFEVDIHEGPDSADPSPPSGPDLHGVVTMNLKQFHDDLGKLIDQWESKV